MSIEEELIAGDMEAQTPGADKSRFLTLEQMAPFLSDATEMDTPTNPSHYSRWKIEPLDFISANNLDFLRGNIIKYIMRYDAKGGLEDLKKARVYLDRLIEKVERNNGMENN